MFKRRQIGAFCSRSCAWTGVSSAMQGGGLEVMYRTTHVGCLSLSTNHRHHHRRHRTGRAAVVAVVHVVDCCSTVAGGVRARIRAGPAAAAAERLVTAATYPRRPCRRRDQRRTSGPATAAGRASCVAPRPGCAAALSAASPATPLRAVAATGRIVPGMTAATSRLRWAATAASESRRRAES